MSRKKSEHAVPLPGNVARKYADEHDRSNSVTMSTAVKGGSASSSARSLVDRRRSSGGGGGGGSNTRRRSSGVSNVLHTLSMFGNKDDPYSISCWDWIRLSCSGVTSCLEQCWDDLRVKYKWFAGKVLQSPIWELGMFWITAYILTGDTWRICYVEKRNDWLVRGFGALALLASIFDIVLRSSVDAGYNCGSFLFWMDVLALYSIVWDVSVLTFTQDEWYYVDVEQVKYIVGETVRVLCLLRLNRLSKLAYVDVRRSLSFWRWRRKPSATKVLPVAPDGDMDPAAATTRGMGGGEQGGSKVGMEFIEVTVRKVIIVIVGVCLFFPLLEPSRIIYPNPLYKFQRGGLYQLHELANDFYGNKSSTPTADQVRVLRTSVQNFVAGIPPTVEIPFSTARVLYLKLVHVPLNVTNSWLQAVNVTMWSVDQIQREYRPIETPAVRVGGAWGSSAIFLGKRRVRWNALLNLMLRGFALVVLAAVGILFSGTQKVVVAPIERMSRMVQRLAEDPLSKLDSKRSSSGDAGLKRSMSMKKQKTSRRASLIDGKDNDETALLETALIKISELLQIGFGVAGAEIIAKNMTGGKDDDQLLGDGKRVTCIFGFTKMEEFTSMCTLLEEDVCTYINTIARIVHENVVMFNGAPNKNTGSAFFCVWKIPEDDPHEPTSPAAKLRMAASLLAQKGGGDDGPKNLHSERVTAIADSALSAVVKTRVDINFTDFSKFVGRQAVIKALGDFKVELNFGLHCGWAIEGALGSVNKIDATYLSPNVNLASRLEAATHQFGVRLLMSGEFVSNLSPRVRELLRNVDVVTVKGSELPMELWTFDITKYPDNKSFAGGKRNSVVARTDTSLPGRLKELQAGLNSQFRHAFNLGLQMYKDGNWRSARDFLKVAMQHVPDDGPTRKILQVIEDAGGTAPDNWKGYRKLLEK